MTTTLILLGLAALLTIAIYVANKAEKVEPLPYEDAYNEAYDNYDELDLMQNPEPVNYGYTQPVIKLKKKTEKKLYPVMEVKYQMI